MFLFKKGALCTLLLCAWSGAALAGDAGMLWRVSGDNNSVYLLGSVHMLRESDFPLPGKIEAAYADAETLVMELDMDDLDPLYVQRLFFTHGRLQEGQTLQSVLGPDNWARASTAASDLGLELSMLNKVEPWWAALTIVQLQLAKLGFNPQLGLEAYFARRAANDAKPITGLETAAYQVALFDNMSMESQVQMLMKSLADAATLETDISELVDAWRQGTIDKLAQLQSETFADFPALYATLIRQRNENWVAELTELLDDEQDYLVLVGALHLVGADGVPAGLAEKGFAVERQ